MKLPKYLKIQPLNIILTYPSNIVLEYILTPFVQYYYSNILIKQFNE